LTDFFGMTITGIANQLALITSDTSSDWNSFKTNAYSIIESLARMACVIKLFFHTEMCWSCYIHTSCPACTDFLQLVCDGKRKKEEIYFFLPGVYSMLWLEKQKWVWLYIVNGGQFHTECISSIGRVWQHAIKKKKCLGTK